MEFIESQILALPPLPLALNYIFLFQLATITVAIFIRILQFNKRIKRKRKKKIQKREKQVKQRKENVEFLLSLFFISASNLTLSHPSFTLFNPKPINHQFSLFLFQQEVHINAYIFFFNLYFFPWPNWSALPFSQGLMETFKKMKIWEKWVHSQNSCWGDICSFTKWCLGQIVIKY